MVLGRQHEADGSNSYENRAAEPLSSVPATMLARADTVNNQMDAGLWHFADIN